MLVLDGGNLFFSKRLLKPLETEQLLLKARTIVEAYNRIGLDALAVGPYDFAAGLDRLLELRERARFPFLCANLIDRTSGAPLFQPTLVLERGGVRVGVIGVIDSFAPIEGLAPHRDRFRVEPIYSAVKRRAAELEAQGCDAVVVLSSANPKHFRLVAKNLRNVQLYVTGDPADKLRLPWRMGPALVTGTTQLGKYLGHVLISFEDGPGAPPRLHHHFVPMKPDYFDDPEVKRIVDGYYKQVAVMKLRNPRHYVKEDEETVNLKYGRAVYVSAAECASCHGELYEKWRATAHARAFEALPPEARSRVECLECHVTGFGRWGGGRSEGPEGPDLRGVQCEACHGPGSLHPASPMQRNGEEVARVCRGCHTRSRSPTFKLSSYLERVACTR
ncbi:MAG: hypothetical protein Kow0092_14230 [Deferrisomatales bacterium]